MSEKKTLGERTLGETFFQEKEGFPQTPFEESRFAPSAPRREGRAARGDE